MEPRARGRALRRGIWIGRRRLADALAGAGRLRPGLDAGPLFSRFVHDGVLLAGAALCLWAGIASPQRRERRAWLLIGAGVAAWTFGEI